MRPLIPIALCIILFAACNNNKSILSKYFTPDNLLGQTFTINIQRDTKVLTKQGIKINIPANAIESGNNTVTLVVKEALALEDMLKAGLTTTTGKELLASDGMFYIGTKEKAGIKKPLHIFLPTAAADKNMQLYKGVEEDGKIDWQAPAKMDKPITNVTDTGEKIFKENCASCHAVENVIVGPALAWEDKHKPMQWVRNFTRNNSKVLASGDKYACCIFLKYKSNMTTFNSLTDGQIDAIYRYIDKISKEMGIPENAAFNSCDSCEYYHDYYYRLALKRDSLIKDNGKMDSIKIVGPPDTNPNADNGIIPEKVRAETFDAEYYQFNITAFGWYNIDDLVEGRFNSVKCVLKVNLTNAETDKINVFLLLPEFKIYNEGGLLDDGSAYGFHKLDGHLFLPQGAAAFTFALGEQNGKLYFGATPFTTALSQVISIDVHESTQKEVNDFFENLKLDKAKIVAEKTKNFDNLKQVDSELNRLVGITSACLCETGDTTWLKHP